MARPQKVGLEYFSLDTVLDDNVELMEAECGLEGFAILIKLWQKIYREGYYIDWEDDNIILFSRKINAEITLVNSVVTKCFERDIFNKKLYDEYKILTSKGIQKRYLLTYKQLKRSYIPMDERYLLINSELTSVITELTPINPEISTQKKVKEKKEEESILKQKQEETVIVDDNSSENISDGWDSEIDNANNSLDGRDSKGGKDLNGRDFQEDPLYDRDLQRVSIVFEQSGFGTINLTVKNIIIDLIQEYSAEWVIEAFKIAVEANKRSLSYVKGILENFKRDGGMKQKGNKTGQTPHKKTRFHNFEQRSDSYTNDQLEEIMEKKRQAAMERMKGGKSI